MKTTRLLNPFFLISVRKIVHDFLAFFRFTKADAGALLLGQIGRRPPESTSIASFRQENGLSPEAVVPADAVTASGSGRRLKKQV